MNRSTRISLAVLAAVTSPLWLTVAGCGLTLMVVCAAVGGLIAEVLDL